MMPWLHYTYPHHMRLHCLRPLDNTIPQDMHSGWQTLTLLDNNNPPYMPQNTSPLSVLLYCHIDLHCTYPNMQMLSTQLSNRTYPLDTLYMPMHRRLNNNPWRKMPDTHSLHWYHSNLH